MKRAMRWWAQFKEFGDLFEPVKDEMNGTMSLKDRFLNMVMSMEISHETFDRRVEMGFSGQVDGRCGSGHEDRIPGFLRLCALGFRTGRYITS